MKKHLKFQTINSIALISMLAILIVSFLVNSLHSKKITGLQQDTKNHYHHVVSESHKIIQLVHDAHSMVSHFHVLENSKQEIIDLKISEFLKEIRQSEANDEINSDQSQQLQTYTKNIKTLLALYIDEETSYSDSDTSLQLKELLEKDMTFMQGILKTPSKNIESNISNLGYSFLYEVETYVLSLRESEQVSIDSALDLLEHISQRLSGLINKFSKNQSNEDDNPSWRLNKKEKMVFVAFNKRYKYYAASAHAVVFSKDEMELTRDDIENIDDNFKSHWQELISFEKKLKSSIDDSQKLRMDVTNRFLQKSHYISLSTAIFGLIWVVIAMIVIRKTLAHRLNILIQGADQFSQGFFERKIELSTNDGFSNLATHFNNMSNKIEKREVQLKKINDSLEMRITERTKELEDSRDAAEAANHAKTEFLSTMSHEIRTPMNGVVGMLELLQQSSLQNDQHRFLSTAKKSANNLLQIINDILDFSKIEANQVELELIPFNMVELIEESATLLAINAHAKQIELICDIDMNLPVHVMGDPTRLRQILINLISNAIKFTEQGEVSITCRLTHVNQIRFEVKDTGIGIPKEIQTKLFESFTQADGSTTRRFGGTGLGLAISKNLTNLMESELKVESKEGKGSCFYFDLVVKPVEPLETNNLINMARSSDFLNTRILIVDDNQNNCEVISTYLSSMRISHDFCTDASCCIEQSKSALRSGKPYSLLFIDSHMPEMSGIEMAEVLKSDKDLSNTPLVLLSPSNILESDVELAGFSACLDKPIRQQQLYETLYWILNPTSVSSKKTKIALKKQSQFQGEVLLVDDHEINRMMADATLKKMGLTVKQAVNGADAVNIWKQGNIDLILMDIQMPVMDGYTATQKIRESEEASEFHQHTPIIAMTANVSIEDKNACLASGMDGHLPKPFEWSQLESILAQWLKAAEYSENSTPLITNNTTRQDVSDLNLPVLDNKRIDESISTLGDNFTRLVEITIESGDESLVKLNLFSQERNPKQVASEAHRLKGAMANIGALEMAECCRLLEKTTKNNDWVTAKQQLEKLLAAYERLKLALKSYIDKGTNSA